MKNNRSNRPSADQEFFFPVSVVKDTFGAGGVDIQDDMYIEETEPADEEDIDDSLDQISKEGLPEHNASSIIEQQATD